MTCAVTELSAYLDGDLSARGHARVTAHLDGCAACRAALAELSALRRGLAELPAVEEGAPDNWFTLARRLTQEQALVQAAPPRRWRWRWAPLSMALSGAFGAAVLLGVQRRGHGLTDDVVIARAEAEFRSADRQYQHAIEQLKGVALRARTVWPAERRAAYDAAQAQLDEAAERCRRVTLERPADVEAEALLFAAYRKQIHFLEDQMMMREAR